MDLESANPEDFEIARAIFEKRLFTEKLKKVQALGYDDLAR